jgi:teichuronic acid biosynthesis glycosyltransferase TuaC
LRRQAIFLAERVVAMRVLLLTGMYPHALLRSAGVAVARQRRSLEELGVEVDLLHARPQGKWQWWATFFALRRLAAAGKYDLVHAHSGFRVTLLAVTQPLPLVLTFHGSDINGYPVDDWRQAPYGLGATGAALVTRQLARRADAVIVMTEEMRGRLPRSVQARTRVEPMGVDTTLFRQHRYEDARRQMGWGSEPTVVFCSNGGKSIKRPELAEAAVRKAQACCPDLRLFVLRGVEPEKVPVILSAADCLLVTSAREGSPNIVRESLACNLPVVSVPVGDVPALLERDPAAGVVAAPDPALLGKALVEVLTRPRPQLSTLMDNYSLPATGRRIVDLYHRVLRGNGARPVAAREEKVGVD